MNYRKVLARLDQLQADLCDLRLAIIDQLPKTPQEERLDQVVDEPQKPKKRRPEQQIKAPPVEKEVAAILSNKDVQRRRLIALGNKQGLFKDPDEDNFIQ